MAFSRAFASFRFVLRFAPGLARQQREDLYSTSRGSQQSPCRRDQICGACSCTAKSRQPIGNHKYGNRSARSRKHTRSAIRPQACDQGRGPAQINLPVRCAARDKNRLIAALPAIRRARPTRRFTSSLRCTASRALASRVQLKHFPVRNYSCTLQPDTARSKVAHRRARLIFVVSAPSRGIRFLRMKPRSNSGAALKSRRPAQIERRHGKTCFD